MTSAFAPSLIAERARVRAGAHARVLATVVVLQVLHGVVMPPRSPGPGRP
jgi:hypothetical protein